MGLKVGFSAEGEDNENNNRCGVGSDESPVNCADSDKVLCAGGGVQSGGTRGAVARSVSLFLLSVEEWEEEEREARREKVEEEGGKVGRGKKKRVAGARRE